MNLTILILHGKFVRVGTFYVYQLIPNNIGQASCGTIYLFV